MKKLYALIATTLLGVSYSNGQVNIQSYNGGSPTGPNLNGTTITRTTTNNELVVVDLGVTNTSGTDKYIQVQRVKIVDVLAWAPTEQICWGFTYGTFPNDITEGNCYSVPFISPNPWTSPAWSNPLPSDTVVANLKFDIQTNSVEYLHYRFYLMENSIKFDSVDVILNPTLGLQTAKKETAAMNVYPNPVNNALTISTNGLSGKLDVRITDVLGNVVMKESMNTGKLVDVSDFKNGVYMVSIFEDGQLVQTRRVVVRH